MEILIFQIALSVFVVWLSITLGEKLNIKYTGLITSFPTIVALVILFIGLGQGSADAGIAAYKISHAIVLFNLWMLFYLAFIRWHPLIAGIGSMILYCLCAFVFYYVFSAIPIVPYAYIFYIAILTLGFFIFPYKKSFNMENSRTEKNHALSVIKYILPPILVIGFTFLSKITSPVWAGIFISAPSTGLVTIFYFHYKYGQAMAIETLSSFYFYTGTFVVFGLSIYALSSYISFIPSFLIAMLLTGLYAELINLKLIPWVRVQFQGI